MASEYEMGLNIQQMEDSLNRIQEIYDEFTRKVKDVSQEFVDGMSTKWNGESCANFFQEFASKLPTYFTDAGGIDEAYRQIINWMNYYANENLKVDNSTYPPFNHAFQAAEVSVDISSISNQDRNIIGITPQAAKDYAEAELNSIIAAVEEFAQETCDVARNCGFLNQDVIQNFSTSIVNNIITMNDNFANYKNTINEGIDSKASQYTSVTQRAADDAIGR